MCRVWQKHSIKHLLATPYTRDVQNTQTFLSMVGPHETLCESDALITKLVQMANSAVAKSGKHHHAHYDDERLINSVGRSRSEQ